jgi:hypothetical protein
MGVVEDHQRREPSMGELTTIGIDLAKNIFQVHGAGSMSVVFVLALPLSPLRMPPAIAGPLRS